MTEKEVDQKEIELNHWTGDAKEWKRLFKNTMH
jgi:hypothetical protein